METADILNIIIAAAVLFVTTVVPIVLAVWTASKNLFSIKESMNRTFHEGFEKAYEKINLQADQSQARHLHVIRSIGGLEVEIKDVKKDVHVTSSEMNSIAQRVAQLESNNRG